MHMILILSSDEQEVSALKERAQALGMVPVVFDTMFSALGFLKNNRVKHIITNFGEPNTEDFIQLVESNYSMLVHNTDWLSDLPGNCYNSESEQFIS